ncbi:MAG: VOC family protein [Blastocatellia bacterium]|nr:VOC family protein [Blastocatellia bacterium]
MAATKAKAIPDGFHGATPYLCIKDAAKALDFYKKAFGAQELMRMGGPDGKIGHAEIKIGEAVIMIADEFPDMGFLSPQTIGGSPVGMMVYVEDVDGFVNKATTAGAKILKPVADQFYGDRSGQLEDPFGHRWYIATHIEDVPPEEMKKRADEFMKQQMKKK